MDTNPNSTTATDGANTNTDKAPPVAARPLVLGKASTAGSDIPGAGRAGRHIPPSGLVNEKDDESAARIAQLTQALEKSQRDTEVIRSQATDLVAANELLQKEKAKMEADSKLAPIPIKSNIDPSKAIYTGPSLGEIYLSLISGVFHRFDPTDGAQMSDRKMGLLSQSILGAATIFHRDAKLRNAFNTTALESQPETTQPE